MHQIQIKDVNSFLQSHGKKRNIFMQGGDDGDSCKVQNQSVAITVFNYKLKFQNHPSKKCNRK